MKYNYTEHNQHLAEIKQNLDTRFSFGFIDGDTVTNSMPYVKCRDFFGDALWAKETNSTKGIYGFKFNPEHQKINEDSTNILVQFVSPESKQAFINAFVYFQEELSGLTNEVSYGTIVDIKEELLLLVQAPTFWQSTIPCISWYTYVLKCFSFPQLKKDKPFFEAVKEMTHTSIDWDDNEVENPTQETNYLTAVINILPKFLKNIQVIMSKSKTVHGYKNSADINIIHNSTGFKSLLSTNYTNNVISKAIHE